MPSTNSHHHCKVETAPARVFFVQRLGRYGLSIVLPFGLFFALREFSTIDAHRPELIVLMLPVTLVGILGGVGPGLVSTVITVILFTGFSQQASGYWPVDWHNDVLSLGALMINGLVVSLFSESHLRLRRRQALQLEQQDLVFTEQQQRLQSQAREALKNRCFVSLRQ